MLKPGDVLYIPPFYFHYVSVVGEDVSISISTHTESEAAKIRDRILNWQDVAFNQEARVKNWNMVNKISGLTSFLSGLFKSSEEKVEIFRHILNTRWAPLKYDKEVLGLVEKLDEAAKTFPSLEQQKTADVPKKIGKRLRGVAIDCRAALSKLSPPVEKIMLENFVEVYAYSFHSNLF